MNEWNRSYAFPEEERPEKREGRKSRAINKRNETVGMKGGT